MSFEEENSMDQVSPQEVSDLFKELRKRDQSALKEARDFILNNFELPEEEAQMTAQEMWMQVVRENTERVKRVISDFGWISSHVFGDRASSDAWLLVQHADHNLDFQKSYLQEMQSFADKTPEEHKHYGYLLDRVLVNSGELQEYGTQGYMDLGVGKWVLHPVREPEHLNKRRLSLGMEPHDEYIQDMNNMTNHE